MKKFFVFLLALLLFPYNAFAISFNDISNHWAKDYIISDIGEKIIDIDGENFMPEEYITNEEFISMLKKFTNEEFEVSDDLKLKENIKRISACGYLADALKLKEDEDALKKFKDFEQIKNPKIGSLVELKIIDGFEDGNFKPDNFLTRSEAVKIFYMANEKLNASEKINKIETVNGEREYSFVIYGSEECPWCQKLKKYLDEKKIAYSFKDIRKDKEMTEKIYDEFYKDKENYDRVYYPTTIISTKKDDKEIKKAVVGFEEEIYDKIFEDIKNDILDEK